MRIWWAAGKYHPHEPAYAEALAGVALASFGSRFIAYAIDFVIATILYSPFYLVVDYFWQRRHGVPDQNIRIIVHLDFHEIWSLAFIVLYFGLSTYWGKGQTIGKRLLRIRVVSLVSDGITLWQSVERALGYGASALEAGFGFVQYFIHGNHCCVHDRIAETIVVQVPRRVKVMLDVDDETALDARSAEEQLESPHERASLVIAGDDAAGEENLRDDANDSA